MSNLNPNSFSIVPGVDGNIRSVDTSGLIGQQGYIHGTVEPSVAAQEQQITASRGVSVRLLFNATAPGHWEIAAGPDDCVIIPSGDLLSCIVECPLPASMSPQSLFIGARCHAGDQSLYAAQLASSDYTLVHVDVDNVITIGSDGDYPSFLEAREHMTAGCTVVYLDAQTSNFDDAMLYKNGGGSDQPFLPPAGVYTSAIDSNGDSVYSISKWTTVTSLKPFGLSIDCAGFANNDYAINFHGGTPLDGFEATKGWSDNSVSGYNLRGVKIQGIVVKNSSGSAFRFIHCDNIWLQYCCSWNCDNNSNMSSNVVSFEALKCKDMLREYCVSIGGGRYTFSTYRSKRVIDRRCIFRLDDVQTAEPISGVSYYTSRDCWAQNVVAFDCDTSQLWASLNVGSLFATPATDDQGYPRGNKFIRCGSVNSDMGFYYSFANDVPVIFDGYHDSEYVDCWSYDTHLKTYNNGNSNFLMSSNGPMSIIRNTISGLTRTGSGELFNNYRRKALFTDTLVDNASSDIFFNGNVEPGKGAELSNVTFSRCNYSNLNEESTNTLTIQSAQYRDAIKMGFRYINRRTEETGEHTGARDGLLGHGKCGTFYGMSGFDQSISIDWLSRIRDYEIKRLMREYSYSGSSGSSDGNRGVAIQWVGMSEYITGQNDTIPYPQTVTVTKIASSAIVTWRPLTAAFAHRLRRIDVYVDDVIVQSCPPESIGCYVFGLSQGQHDVSVRYVGATESSAKSDIVGVTI